MVILGLLLIIVGAIAILSAVFVSEPGTGGELLGFEVTAIECFLVGVAAGAAILWGFSILKWGTKRGLGPAQGAQGAEQAQREARPRRGRAPAGHHPDEQHLTSPDSSAGPARASAVTS